MYALGDLIRDEDHHPTTPGASGVHFEHSGFGGEKPPCCID
jgi:hypothetical protein